MTVFKYLVESGSQIISQGALAAETEQDATAQMFQRIRRGTNGVKITLNGKVVYSEGTDPGTKLFARPVAKKVDNRPPRIW